MKNGVFLEDNRIHIRVRMQTGDKMTLCDEHTYDGVYV